MREVLCLASALNVSCYCLQASSAISHLVAELKQSGFRLSTNAWYANYRQRVALGLLTFPVSSLTQQSLAFAPAKGLDELSRDALTKAARPQAVRRPSHTEHTVQLLNARKIAVARKELRQAVVNYPTDPLAWMLLAEIEMYYRMRYADARKLARASLEALAIAETQTATLASRKLDMGKTERFLAVLRCKVWFKSC